MTLDELIQDDDNQFVEKGGSPNAMSQCVDLANDYIDRVLGHAIILGTNADDFPSKCMDFCDWYPTTSGMQKGDIVIWGHGVGNAGHIAIYVSGNSTFTSFDQNWPLNSPCHLQNHNLSNIEGYLRPHGGTMSDDQLKALLTGFVRTSHAILFGDAPDQLIGEEVTYRFNNIKNGGTDEFGSQVNDYFSSPKYVPKLLWMLKKDCKPCPPPVVCSPKDCSDEIKVAIKEFGDQNPCPICPPEKICPELDIMTPWEKIRMGLWEWLSGSNKVK